MHSDNLEICLDKVAGTESFDEIRIGRFTRISFHRTLRIPEDGRDYPLPAGLGRFPIHRVEDYAEKVPAKWLIDGGFFIPLYQKEALFLQFDGPNWHPTIAKVCVGKINAISGRPYSELLSRQQQDYVVIPNQKWLDGICAGEGLVKQFVAMPLGKGYTIEAQITDEEQFGSFQIVVMNAVEDRFPNRDPIIDQKVIDEEQYQRTGILFQRVESAMGIAAGGSIRQSIYKDTYGVETWNPERKTSLTIHLINSMAYKAITGIDAPSSPISVEEYERARIPWYSHYDETAPVIKSPSIFKRIMSIAAINNKRGITSSDDEVYRSAAIQNIRKIRTPDKNEASKIYRIRAHENLLNERWESALRDISYVIDLNVDLTADDYALRSRCNYNMDRYRDGSIDGSLGLEKDPGSVESLLCRAYCRYGLGEYDKLDEDANSLIEIQETELIGLEMKAEAALLAGRYDDAHKTAMKLKIRNPGHIRADEILHEVQEKIP